MTHLFTKQTIKQLPQGPGVYIFRDITGTVLYVGKAVNLKKRVSQYMISNRATTQRKTTILVSKIHSVETIETASEFDALLLEADRIRMFNPKYNVISKDDKSSLYVVITMSQELPRILFLRKTQLTKLNSQDSVFGPFQSARMARTLLRSIRRIVPFCTAKKRNGAPCFYTQLSLCNPCPSLIHKMPASEARNTLARQYRSNMHRIRDILSGKSHIVLKMFEASMIKYARSHDYESAARMRDRIRTLTSLLEKRYDPAVYTEKSTVIDVYASENTRLTTLMQSLYPSIKHISRIECYDISNTTDRFAVGSMVVLTDGLPDRSQYRRFRIAKTKGINDRAMIAEVLRRRFNHEEWSLPNLIIVDGGKPQVSSALSVIRTSKKDIPIIGLAKRFEEIIVPKNQSYHVLRLDRADPALHILQRIRDEAHRFALTYNRSIRAKQFLKK